MKLGLTRGRCGLAVVTAFSALALASHARAGAPRGADGRVLRRQEVFAFARKPIVKRRGDRVAIAFESKGYCDVTVAIENSDGRIVRHLASGVLGENAPAPFAKKSLKQELVWDGKDDLGKYVDDKDRHSVRVSLGLKARFERTLFWSPAKRTRAIKYMSISQVMAAAPEGVYVYDGGNCEHIRLYDHNGDYLRTVHPPPAKQLAGYRGLVRRTFPQDGKKLPLKWGLPQNSFLTTGLLGSTAAWPTRAAASVQSMAVHGKSIFLAGQRLNHLATDGSTGGRLLHGPELWFTVKLGRMHEYRGGTEKLPAGSLAVSPDGKWLYTAGYVYTRSWHQGGLHGVARTPADFSKRAEPFLGSLKPGARGKANGQFDVAGSVDVDKSGRIYVADYGNDRVQVFSASGKHLKNIRAPRPALVRVSPRNGQIYVFSWKLPHHRGGKQHGVKPQLRKFGPFEKPKLLANYPLNTQNPLLNGHPHHAAVDFWTDPPTIWLSEAPTTASYRSARIDRAGVRLLVEKGGKLAVKRDFAAEARKDVVFHRPTRHMKQRLFFDHKNRRLFVGELYDPMPIHCTSMSDAARINPENGKVEWVRFPFDCEDLAFDMEGLAYLRTEDKVARFDARLWREVPFDYGAEFRAITTHGVRKTKVFSAIVFSGQFEASSQLGGMNVSPKGHVVVTACNPGKAPARRGPRQMGGAAVRPYTPRIYPGRARPWEIHVWDKHGKIRYRDAVASLGRPVGVAMDRNDDIYVVIAGNARLGEKTYFNPITCTYVKTPPNSRFLATKAALPLGETRPKRPPDIRRAEFAGDTWAVGAYWLRGGVGLDGKRAKCHCPSQSRPALDYFARSFLPEVDHYSVLVLDTNGNQILRVGKYGNVDDGLPLVKKGGPPEPRAIGGDEVAIMHAQHVAVHSDRRLFVGDLGNARILSVKLGYHASEKVALKDVADELKGRR